MTAIIALLAALTFSILLTRVATVALMLTGISREIARFQARSALTGVGFTTAESEKIVSHPVRRRILMLLMLVGNIGIVKVVSTAIIAFVNKDSTGAWLPRAGILVGGLILILVASYSSWVDKRLSRVISLALKRWTKLEVKDYVSLLRIGDEYQVSELQAQEQDWVTGKTLAQLGLSEEGVIILGLQQRGGEYIGAPLPSTVVTVGDVLVLYGRAASIDDIDKRHRGLAGSLARLDAIAEQQRLVAEQEEVQERGLSES